MSEHDGEIPLTGKPNPTPDFIAQKLEVKSFINLLSSMRIFHRTFSFCPSTRPGQKLKQLQIHCNIHKARGAYLGHTSSTSTKNGRIWPENDRKCTLENNLSRSKIEKNGVYDFNFSRRASGSEIWPFKVEIPVRVISLYIYSSLVQN